MLLIGSRAILYHMPDFRPPRDWDLVGTDEEIERLDRVLPRIDKMPRRREKAYFRHRDVMVEVANASATPYWGKVVATFADGPSIVEPVLGELRIPPVEYLMLTKHCGLIYHVLHWHKNLEDLYFLRDRIQTIPERVAALLPDTLADSRRMFAERHAKSDLAAQPCHPAATRGPLDPVLHRELHERLKVGAAPAVSEPRAWEGFPERTGEARRARMIDLFAEETAVMAAEHALRLTPDRARPEAELIRWAVRMLIVSSMPDSLRYFGVNYYREIVERVPRGWLAALQVRR